MLTDVSGVRVGHWTDPVARTGCTVVLLPAGTVAAAEVRGGAPATRELDVLVPGRLVDRLDAVVLTGGSAFGLAAADGVMRWCEERGIGFPTGAGPVPIVAALGLYDLTVGDASVRPRAEDGYSACGTATDGPIPLGAVGAGTGATVGKWRGPEAVGPGGIGSATVRHGELVVSALVAVNALGDVDHDGTGLDTALALLPVETGGFGATNTTIGVVVTNARLDKTACRWVAEGAHDGFARAIVPAHTRFDGDAVVAAATGALGAGDQPAAGPGVGVDVDTVRLLAVGAVVAAIRSAVAGP